MAEQTPSNDGSTDFLRKKTHLEKQSDDAKLTSGQRSLPPKRGLLKRSKGSAAPGRTDSTRRVMRTPITREQTGPRSPIPVADTSHLAPPTPPSLQKPAQAKVRRPAAAKRDVPAVSNVARTRQSADHHEKRLIEAEERKKANAEREKQQAEIKAARQAERDRKSQLRADAQKKAEEERRQKQKELQLRKAEAARIRVEKEAEAKRLEAERLVKEKEVELKRLEEEKIFQEQEGQRIFKSIEACQGKLSEKEQQLARIIADQMVKRNIHWEGYISLHSGIGGAMLS